MKYWEHRIRLFQQDDDDDDVFEGPDGVGGVPSGDVTQAEFPLSQDTTFGDSSQGLSFTNESVVDQTMFAGDGLVAQPNKVSVLFDITFPRTSFVC